MNGAADEEYFPDRTQPPSLATMSKAPTKTRGGRAWTKPAELAELQKHVI
jgi:hypothetical protein